MVLKPLKGDKLFHMKAINVDDETLYMGSANFSVFAYHFNWGEYYLIERDKHLIKFYMQLIMHTVQRFIQS
jgi:phosphatidylserine/phosphatidylglycerophosphate/cardiolipin synthase-like enzyme